MQRFESGSNLSGQTGSMIFSWNYFKVACLLKILQKNSLFNIYVFILFSNNRAMEKFDLWCKEQENCLKVREYLCNRSLFLSPSLPHMSRHSGHLQHDSCAPHSICLCTCYSKLLGYGLILTTLYQVWDLTELCSSAGSRPSPKHLNNYETPKLSHLVQVNIWRNNGSRCSIN